MQTYRVCLHFNGPAHFGEASSGLETTAITVPSDTLFSALCHAYADVFGVDGLTELLDWFREVGPPFRVTSAFPWVNGEPYLVKPLLPPPADADEAVWAALRRVEFLPQRLFVDWISSPAVSQWRESGRSPLSPTMFAAWVRGGVSDGPTFAAEVSEAQARLRRAVRVTLTPRAALDRASQTAHLYHCGVVHFTEGSGLHCLVHVAEPGFWTLLQAAFRRLGDRGLGGERSAGYGSFTPTFETVPDFPDVGPEATAFCTLSLYAPTPKELSQPFDTSAYRLVTRPGWVTSSEVRQSFRRKVCTLLATGSVLPFQPEGQLVDVTPPNWPPGAHRVWRYGLAWPVGVSLPHHLS